MLYGDDFGGEILSIDYYRDLCARNCGNAVEITTFDGDIYRGVIDRIEGDYVYLNPLNDNDGFENGVSGFILSGIGFGIGIALGAIATFALLPRFFW